MLTNFWFFDGLICDYKDSKFNSFIIIIRSELPLLPPLTMSSISLRNVLSGNDTVAVNPGAIKQSTCTEGNWLRCDFCNLDPSVWL